MRAGTVLSLLLMAMEVSDYPPLVANVLQAQIKVCVVHDDLSIILHAINTSCSSPALITPSLSITLALLFG